MELFRAEMGTSEACPCMSLREPSAAAIAASLADLSPLLLLITLWRRACTDMLFALAAERDTLLGRPRGEPEEERRGEEEDTLLLARSECVCVAEVAMGKLCGAYLAPSHECAVCAPFGVRGE